MKWAQKRLRPTTATQEEGADAGEGRTTLSTPTTRPRGATGCKTQCCGPRDVLDMYAKMVDGADEVACITLAFGISAVFKDLLGDNTPKSPIAFFLLEKEDKPNPRSKTKFVGLNAANNVYKAWGSFLREPLYQWTKETNAQALKLNQHVSYIHSKFLLMDPLSKDPIVVTGSANFSKASTNDNDENMLVIRGDRRVADIYFTEFNRLFYHYYFRSIQETTGVVDHLDHSIRRVSGDRMRSTVTASLHSSRELRRLRLAREVRPKRSGE